MDRPGFTDCYMIEVPGTVTQAAFVEAFYTSPLFKIERTILGYLASLPSTDADAHALAHGQATKFSAWTVERQTTSELLLADITGRTRSWLMAVAMPGPRHIGTTKLYFGSAVLPQSQGPNPKMGYLFHALGGFHRRYSLWLLSAACKRITG